MTAHPGAKPPVKLARSCTRLEALRGGRRPTGQGADKTVQISSLASLNLRHAMVQLKTKKLAKVKKQRAKLPEHSIGAGRHPHLAAYRS